MLKVVYIEIRLKQCRTGARFVCTAFNCAHADTARAVALPFAFTAYRRAAATSAGGSLRRRSCADAAKGLQDARSAKAAAVAYASTADDDIAASNAWSQGKECSGGGNKRSTRGISGGKTKTKVVDRNKRRQKDKTLRMTRVTHSPH